MNSARKSSKNKPDVFRDICGGHAVVPNINPATSFIKRAYHANFGMKFGDQDKVWWPHTVCTISTEYL